MRTAETLHEKPFFEIPSRPHKVFLSIVVPLFNEVESVEALMFALETAMSHYAQSWEVILVDDGSTDGTVGQVKKLLATKINSIQLVELSRNYGQTAAMQAGIDSAQGEFIVTMDGDLQNDPSDIPPMVAHLINEDLDLLVGWRKRRQDNFIARKIPSWIANQLIRTISGVHIHDYGCSLKIYRGEVIRNIKLMGEMHRFIPIWVAGVVPPSRIGEVEVKHHARQFGVSKYGISRSVRVFLDLLSVMFFRRYLARPGHFFGTIGLLIGFIGTCMLFWLAVDKFILGHDIGTRPLLLVGVVSVLMSLQFITTGILAEMISRTYFNASGKRSYVVRNVYKAK
jgi:glycosyltransferase involved in cell wall biosynthesis